MWKIKESLKPKNASWVSVWRKRYQHRDNMGPRQFTTKEIHHYLDNCRLHSWPPVTIHQLGFLLSVWYMQALQVRLMFNIHCACAGYFRLQTHAFAMVWGDMLFNSLGVLVLWAVKNRLSLWYLTESHMHWLNHCWVAILLVSFSSVATLLHGILLTGWDKGMISTFEKWLVEALDIERFRTTWLERFTCHTFLFHYSR